MRADIHNDANTAFQVLKSLYLCHKVCKGHAFAAGMRVIELGAGGKVVKFARNLVEFGYTTTDL